MPNKSIWNQAFNNSTYTDGYGTVREDNIKPLAKWLRQIGEQLHAANKWLNPADDGIVLIDPDTGYGTTVHPKQGLGILELLNPEAQALIVTKFPKSKSIKEVSMSLPKLLENGKQNATLYLRSTEKAIVDKHNERVAKRLANRHEEYGSFKNFKPSTNADRASAIGQVEFTRGPRSEAGAYIRTNNIPDDDITQINLNVPDRFDETMFHESLHAGNYGATAIKDNTSKEVVRAQEDFYDFLNQKIRDKDKPYYDYLDNIEYGEFAANLRELGYQNGINPDVPYPGDEAAIEIFKTLAQDQDKGWIFDYLRKDKPQRLWKAINGTYYENGGTIPTKYLFGGNIPTILKQQKPAH